MTNLKPYFRIIFLFTLLFLIASCSPQTSPADSDVAAGESMDDDHGDEDDHDDDHGDEDDHDDDDDHGDEDDHDDDDHDDEERREHGAHEHGEAEMSVALIDGQAEIALESPAYNLVGFEYAPSTDEEIAAVDAATAILETGEWLTLSDAAGCTLTSADVDSSMADADHDDDDHDDEGEDHDEEEEGHDDEDDHDDDHDDEKETHSSFFVTYKFDCPSLENLTSLDATALFASFPNFEEVDAQWLNDTQQSAAVLNKDQPVLAFE